jgi:hypothetical protein
VIAKSGEVSGGERNEDREDAETWGAGTTRRRISLVTSLSRFLSTLFNCATDTWRKATHRHYTDHWVRLSDFDERTCDL